jgi:hypothetical protein
MKKIQKNLSVGGQVIEIRSFPRNSAILTGSIMDGTEANPLRAEGENRGGGRISGFTPS